MTYKEFLQKHLDEARRARDEADEKYHAALAEMERLQKVIESAKAVRDQCQNQLNLSRFSSSLLNDYEDHYGEMGGE